ncbi:hypothetical protein [Mycobacteroides abscessus]|uniref:hypothetical protein n=2 Tax=Mycobacteroides abscessus TaxID=36809 RepID=UPI0002317518|nr:hypothetical protein [Mycobacteroides abscessus]QST89199.1 RecT-like ssDNA binding protein [Mycobacterium phage prophiGD44-1]AWG57935.1 hypothetical protein DDT47_02085 [Mycobacteroides abscessus]EHB98378.1 hypothetical protein MAB47J26_14327 [Mycobacteroides abscessus 47J26]MBN7419528.1 hypothetical protein [Mycobacteroides abscessus subsp. massiliense]MDM2160847.1 hypothetical protein [Mycobacteroides abscessus]
MTVTPYQPISPAPRTAVSQATSVEQSRAVAEVQSAVIVAQQIPRDMQRAEAEMRDTCNRSAMAKQAFYQVPNRGNGASVHLMRELARVWGNVQYGVNELHRDDSRGESEVQAWAWDVQTNTRSTRTFIVPHARMSKGRRQELTDLGDITNNNNNAGARAVRECINAILPKWFTEAAQDICKATLENGEGVPLPKRIEDMIAGFRAIGVSQAQLETKIGKKRGAWDAGDVAQMGITYTSITRDGYDKAEMFPPVAGVTTDEIKAKAPDKPKTEAAPAPEQAPSPEKAEEAPEANPAEYNSRGEFLATKKTIGTIRGLLGNAGYSLRGDAATVKTLTYLATVVGREIADINDLSEAEAEVVTDVLNQPTTTEGNE